MARLLSTLLLIVFALQSNQAFSRTYTSLKSGNFSAGSTWVGGLAPVTSSTQADTIIVVSGHDVILNQDFRVTQSAGFINVLGNLRNFGTTTTLTMLNSSRLWVYGVLIVDSLVTGNNVFNINGQATARALRCNGLTAAGNGTLNVNGHLYMHDNMVITGGNKLNIGINTTIHMAGGALSPSTSANISFASAYDVEYTGTSYNVPMGAEVTGSWLQDLTIKVPTGKEILMNRNLNITNGYLRLRSGLFNLNGYELKLDYGGRIDTIGTGLFKSTKNSTLKIYANRPFRESFEFDTSGHTLGVLILHPSSLSPLYTLVPIRFSSNLIITERLELATVSLVLTDSNNIYFTEGARIIGADTTKGVWPMKGNIIADIGPADSFLYPIGQGTSDVVNNPYHFHITLKSNDSKVAEKVAVRITQFVYNMGNSGSKLDPAIHRFVKTTWHVENDGTPVNMDAEIMWKQVWESTAFNRDIAYISQFHQNYWDKIPGTLATSLNNGWYSVRREGITTLTPMTIYDDSTVSIENIATKETITLYPNPVGDVLHIGNLTQSAQVTIYNTTGAAVITQQVNKNQNTISTASLPAGTYFVQLKGEGVDASGRIVKQ